MFNQLYINNIRNIEQQTLAPFKQINLLYGANGSGKTSVLEAIHMVALARSFRQNIVRPVVKRGQQSLTVHAQFHSSDGITRNVGIQRSLKGEPLIRIDGETVRTVSQLAGIFPVLVMDANIFSLLDGSSKVRRQFLDWGVFHVEHSFFDAWRAYQRCLKQRNSLLRQGSGINNAQLAIWNEELSRYAVTIDNCRERYFNEFVLVFNQVLARLTECTDIQLEYRRGWDSQIDLSNVLTTTVERDTQLGYTQYGPHRADIKIRHQGVEASSLLSRGQQKIVAAALKIAQGLHYKQSKSHHCIYLLDDLPAEIDSNHRQAVCDLFVEQGAQVFITCIDKASIVGCFDKAKDLQVFHVEQGSVKPEPSEEGICGDSND
ncbi:DNA replication/repair protein RecF [Sinobacterium norvegicum]|uniref:DNA replication/repair protein RecF n=1 Tax=Sinobacterium norvegicum TaxID=1641715 RepID=UPI001F02C22C|nr:DNA replication/repair protein RecF [Sinobacterium norvegicum]